MYPLKSCWKTIHTFAVHLKVYHSQSPIIRTVSVYCSAESICAQIKETARGSISNGSLPNLFTLCTLQVFTTPDRAKCFYQVPCHFCSYDSATCLIAGKTKGIHDTVKPLGGQPCVLYSFSELRNAVSVITFDQFKVLWCHFGGLSLREQANSKVWLTYPPAFLLPIGIEQL